MTPVVLTCILAPMALASTTSAHPLAHYRSEFPIFERQVYLNSCSLGALSSRSRAKVEVANQDGVTVAAAEHLMAWVRNP